MPHTSVICLTTTRLKAEAIVRRLQDFGFPSADISVVLPEDRFADGSKENRDRVCLEGGGTVAGAEAARGWRLGLPAGVGVVAVPGDGPLLAAGSTLTTAGGNSVGVTTGGLAGGLIGHGVPEYEARRYAGKVRQGRILISVNTEDTAEVALARSILTNAGAEDISSTRRTGGFPTESNPPVGRDVRS